MAAGGGGTAGPFAKAAFIANAIPTAPKPPELLTARLYDLILRTYPGYTLSTLLAEDAHEMMQMLALLDRDIGKAES